MPYLFIFIIGTAVGSFVNVVIYRLPQGLGIVGGRSRCEGCGKNIRWFDLIPLVSFLMLRGQCRDCKFKISFVHPLIELYSGLIFFFSFKTIFPLGLVNWIFSVAILEIFLILALVDLKHFILPDSIIIFLLGATVIYGLIERLFFSERAIYPVISFSGLEGFLLAFIPFFAIWFFSGGRGMGLGDIKLAAVLGFIFGSTGVLLVLYGAVALGAIVGIFMLLFRKAGLSTKLPLGTFISFTASLYVFFGSQIVFYLSDNLHFIENIWH